MKIHWTNKALNDLLSIYEYIEASSPTYADRVVDKLTRRTEQIEDFPRSGRMVPEHEQKDLRELIESPYRTIKGQITITNGNPEQAVKPLNRISGIRLCRFLPLF